MRQIDTTLEVFAYIRAYVTEHPWPPTLQEIADGVGLAWPSSVQRHLRRLEGWELIRRHAGRPRGIELTDKGQRLSSAFTTVLDDDEE